MVLQGDPAEPRALLAHPHAVRRLQSGLFHGPVLSDRRVADPGSDHASRRGGISWRAPRPAWRAAPRLHPHPRPDHRRPGGNRARPSVPGDARLARAARRDHSRTDVVRRGVAALFRRLCRLARRNRPGAARKAAALSLEPRPCDRRFGNGRGRVPAAPQLAGRLRSHGAPARLFRQLRRPVPRRLPWREGSLARERSGRSALRLAQGLPRFRAGVSSGAARSSPIRGRTDFAERRVQRRGRLLRRLGAPVRLGRHSDPARLLSAPLCRLGSALARSGPAGGVAIAMRDLAAPALVKFALAGSAACVLCFFAAGALLEIPAVRRVV